MGASLEIMAIIEAIKSTNAIKRGDIKNIKNVTRQKESVDMSVQLFYICFVTSAIVAISTCMFVWALVRIPIETMGTRQKV